jgi:hypothetical protein
MNRLEELLEQLLQVLADEELYRLRHRAKKRALMDLADLLSAEIGRREAK